MDTGNTTVPSMESALEISSKYLDSFKCKTDNEEQPGPLMSTSKPIPIASPESNSVGEAAGIARVDELFDVIKSVPILLTQGLSQSNITRFKLVDMKRSFEILSNKINCVTPEDKETIGNIKSKIASYQQTVINMKSNPPLESLEETLDRISSYIDDNPAVERTGEVFENLYTSIELFQDHKKDIEHFFGHIDILLDCMLNQLSCIETSKKNIEEAGVIE